jgi:hypothetical protein
MKEDESESASENTASDSETDSEEEAKQSIRTLQRKQISTARKLNDLNIKLMLKTLRKEGKRKLSTRKLKNKESRKVKEKNLDKPSIKRIPMSEDQLAVDGLSNVSDEGEDAIEPLREEEKITDESEVETLDVAKKQEDTSKFKKRKLETNKEAGEGTSNEPAVSETVERKVAEEKKQAAKELAKKAKTEDPRRENKPTKNQSGENRRGQGDRSYNTHGKGIKHHGERKK